MATVLINQEPQKRERSREWLENRIVHLEQKDQDFDTRRKNLRKELASRKEELAAMKKGGTKAKKSK